MINNILMVLGATVSGNSSSSIPQKTPTPMLSNLSNTIKAFEKVAEDKWCNKRFRIKDSNGNNVHFTDETDETFVDKVKQIEGCQDTQYILVFHGSRNYHEKTYCCRNDFTLDKAKKLDRNSKGFIYKLTGIGSTNHCDARVENAIGNAVAQEQAEAAAESQAKLIEAEARLAEDRVRADEAEATARAAQKQAAAAYAAEIAELEQQVEDATSQRGQAEAQQALDQLRNDEAIEGLNEAIATTQGAADAWQTTAKDTQEELATALAALGEQERVNAQLTSVNQENERVNEEQARVIEEQARNNEGEQLEKNSNKQECLNYFIRDGWFEDSTLKFFAQSCIGMTEYSLTKAMLLLE